MKITDAPFHKISTLARLDFSRGPNQAVTAGADPLPHFSSETNPFFEDVFVSEITQQAVLQNTSDADSDYFRGPRFSKLTF